MCQRPQVFAERPCADLVRRSSRPLRPSTAPDEMAVSFHHRLVSIHAFPNGNGRHARLMADELVLRLARPRFTWGSNSLVGSGDPRTRYLDALRAADAGEVAPLLRFARS
ncbi:Fic family protein [Variovorax sp. LjRoot290]|uniref:Fic family protein n=1 Tax=Variovorax sp. LjRoot290 TaxID=3342316 RepID=UPI003F516225